MQTTSFLKYINKNLERDLMFLSLLVISILIIFQIFMRYIVGQSTSWTEELIIWSFVWFIWLGVSYGYSTNKHISVTLFVNKLPGKISKLTSILILIISLVFFVYISYMSYTKHALSPFIVNQSSPVIFNPITKDNVSLFWLYLSMPVGAGLSAIRVMQNIYKEIKELNSNDILMKRGEQ